MKGGFHTRREADDALAELLVADRTGAVVRPARDRVATWLEEWLFTVGPSLRPTTLELYTRVVRAWIVPRIGGLKLEQVTPQVLQGLYADLAASGRRESGGLGPRSVRLAHQVLRQALGKAVDWHLLRTNPAEAGLDLPRMKSEPIDT
jgi:hypothetical protein